LILRHSFRAFLDTSLATHQINDKELTKRAERDLCVSFVNAGKWSSWFKEACKEARLKLKQRQKNENSSSLGESDRDNRNKNDIISSSDIDKRIHTAVTAAVKAALDKKQDGKKDKRAATQDRKRQAEEVSIHSQMEVLREQVSSLQETLHLLLVRDRPDVAANESNEKSMTPAQLRMRAMTLLGRGDAQAAFNLMLNADNIELVEWLCHKVREPGFPGSLEDLNLSPELWGCLMQQLSTNLEQSTSSKLHDIEVAFSHVDFEGPNVSAFATETVKSTYLNLNHALQELRQHFPISVERRMHFLAETIRKTTNLF
jgi:hypothetical protein